jgi:hypothetical protein
MAVLSVPHNGKKGESLMLSSPFVPWYNRPAREFPALVWLRQRYPFLVSPLVFARYRQPRPSDGASQQRPFPAKVWREKLLKQRAGD